MPSQFISAEVKVEFRPCKIGEYHKLSKDKFMCELC